MTYAAVKCTLCGETYEWVPDNIYRGPEDGVRGVCLPCEFDAVLRTVVDEGVAARIKAAMNAAGLLLATHSDYGVEP